MSSVDIKRVNAGTVFSTPINIGSKLKYALMKEHYITLKFSVENPIYFNLGDYADLGEYGIFELISPYKPSMNISNGGYDYELKLDAYYWKWKNKIFKYTPEHFGIESSWSLTAPLETHLNVFLKNLSALGYTYRGSSFNYNISGLSTSPLFISYDNCSLIEALNKMCDAMTSLNTDGTCEWWITGNTINFGKCENGSTIDFSLDTNVRKMDPSNNSDRYATRLFVFGGTQNVPLRYRKQLLFTVTKTGSYVIDGVTYNQFWDDERLIKSSFFNSADIVNNTLTATLTFSVLNGNPVNEKHVCRAPLLTTISAGLFYIDSLNVKIGDTFTIDNIIENNVPDSYFTKIDSDVVNGGVVQNNLMLPSGYECIDSDGLAENNYKGTLPTEAYVEQVIVNEEIYPQFNWGKTGDPGSVTAVARDDNHYKKDSNGNLTDEQYPVYTVTDNYLKDFKDSYILATKKLHIIFQTGLLAGLGFDVNLNSTNSKKSELTTFEILANETYGRLLPDLFAYPQIGDTYVLSNYDADLVSESLTPAAEQQLLAWGVSQRDKMSIDPATYTCTMQSGGSIYNMGQKIALHNDAYFGQGIIRESRIIGLELNLDIPNDSPIFTVGESASYSRLSNLEEKIDEIQVNGKTYTYAGGIGTSGSYGPTSVYVISSQENTEASDANVFSSLKSLDTFLRKDKEDSSSFLLHFLKGLGIGSGSMGIDENGNATLNNIAAQLGIQAGDYQTGILGKGAKIDANGNGEMRSLKLWEFLEVPELRYNRVTVFQGDTIKSIAAGIVESINQTDSTHGVLKLKLGKGEFGMFDVDDIGFQIFHDELTESNNSGTTIDDGKGNRFITGFATVMFRVTAVSGDNNQNISYELRALSSNWTKQLHPYVGGSIAQRGNFSKTERMKLIYEGIYPASYQRYLADVNDYEFTEAMIKAQFGDLSNLNTAFSLNMTGYSAYLNNIYMSGSIQQIEGGKNLQTLSWRGEWVSGETYHYNDRVQDEVVHQGCYYVCLNEDTAETPSPYAVDWKLIIGDTTLSLDINSTNGVTFLRGYLNTTLISSVKRGLFDITDEIISWKWTRSSEGNINAGDSDASWNALHTQSVNNISITDDDINGTSNIFTCEALVFNKITTTNSITI